MSLPAVILAGVLGAAAAACQGAECESAEATLLQTHSTLDGTTVPKDYYDLSEKRLVHEGAKYNRYIAKYAQIGRMGPCLGNCWTKEITWKYGEGFSDAWADGNIKASGQYEVTKDMLHSGSAGLEAKFKDVSAAANITWNGSYNGSYTLQMFRIDDWGKVQRWMNGEKLTDDFRTVNLSELEQRKRDLWWQEWDEMEKDGSVKPRLCGAIWVVVQANSKEIASSCLGGALSIKYKEVASAWVKGESCKSRTWSIPANAVIAYQSYRVVKDKKTGRVTDFRQEQY